MQDKESNHIRTGEGDIMRELKITECENGYILESQIEITEGRFEPSYEVVEEIKDDRDCMKRLLELIASFFGHDYNKFAPDNLKITFDKKGHKYVKPVARMDNNIDEDNSTAF